MWMYAHPVCESLGLTQCVGDDLGLMWIRGPSFEALERLFLKAVGDVEAHGALGIPSMAVSPGHGMGHVWER